MDVYGSPQYVIGHALSSNTRFQQAMQNVGLVVENGSGLLNQQQGQPFEEVTFELPPGFKANLAELYPNLNFPMLVDNHEGDPVEINAARFIQLEVVGADVVFQADFAEIQEIILELYPNYISDRPQNSFQLELISTYTDSDGDRRVRSIAVATASRDGVSPFILFPSGLGEDDQPIPTPLYEMPKPFARFMPDLLEGEQQQGLVLATRYYDNEADAAYLDVIVFEFTADGLVVRDLRGRGVKEDRIDLNAIWGDVLGESNPYTLEVNRGTGIASYSYGDDEGNVGGGDMLPNLQLAPQGEQEP